MSIDAITKECRQRMDKTFDYFRNELRGIRTGRATTALIDYVKVEYYGNHTDLRELAAISVPEPTMLMVKPFDPTVKNEIIKSLETADLGLNPQAEGDAIRISIPPPSAERRRQLVTQVKKMAEDAKVSVRNERRDANKHIDQAVKDKTNAISEDQGKDAKDAIEDLTKSHVKQIDDTCDAKVKEVEAV